MTDQTKHGTGENPGEYEHQDLLPGGILYFLLTLGLLTMLCMLGIKGLYGFLDRRERAALPMSPLLTKVPEDTRHVPRGYPQATFPDPRLEEDERGQLNGIRTDWNNTLYSYGWVDEPGGTVRIPIDRAMDLLVQRGLPVRPKGVAGQTEDDKPEASMTDADATALSKGKKN
jgi:hypothetical protein